MHPPTGCTPRPTIDAHRRLPGIDSLRGIAIVLVIALHVQLAFGSDHMIGKLALMGYVGVQIFFVVSAITMCHIWSLRINESEPIKKFFIRRMCRIAPPFWFAILFYFLWRFTKFSNLPPATWVDDLLTGFFLHGLWPRTINLVVPGGWSIAAEVGFYAFFPGLLSVAPTGRKRLWFAFVSYLICTAASQILTNEFHVEGLFLYYSLLTQFPVFLLAMALFSMTLGAEPKLLKEAVFVLAMWLTCAILGKYLGYLTRPVMWLQVFVILIIVAAVLGRMSWWPLEFFGKLSYSAYLFHFAVIDVLIYYGPHSRSTGIFLLAFTVTCMATATIAWVSSKTLERWSTQLGRQLIEFIGRKPARSSL